MESQDNPIFRLSYYDIVRSEDFLYLLRKNKPEDNTADKYLSAFSKDNSFNWSAFFFPMYWYAYRQMFGKAVIYSLIYWFLPITATVCKAYFNGFYMTNSIAALYPKTSLLVGIIIHITFGFIANKEYECSLIDRFIAANTVPAEEKARYLEKNRGTCCSYWWIILLNFLLYVLNYLIGLPIIDHG